MIPQMKRSLQIRTLPAMEAPFLSFYEDLMTMVREGAPPATIAERIRRAIPDPDSRKQLLGHLRDSRNAFEADGKDEAAETLEQVVKVLEKPEVT